MASYFFKKYEFFLCWWAALDPLAGRVFETPAVVCVSGSVSVHSYNFVSTARVELFKILSDVLDSSVLSHLVDLTQCPK